MTDPAMRIGAGGRLPSLDGLRGLALLAVFAHQFERVDAPAGLAARAVATLLDRGWIGVQLFFVLSGFLITGLLMAGGRSTGALGAFYARRARRILPLYAAVLAAVLLVSAVSAVPTGCGPMPDPVWPYALLLSNWTDPFATTRNGCLVHLWSLAIEEQFYLLWPLLVAGRSPGTVLRRSILVFAIACLVRPLLLAAGVPAEAVYTGSPCRMDALAAGAAVAAWWRLPAGARPQVPPAVLALAGLLALAAGWFVADGYARTTPAGQTLGYPILALACAALLAAAVTADAGGTGGATGGATDGATGGATDGARGIRRLLTPGWLRGIGRHSYAMYLLHRPFDLLVGRPLLDAAGLGAQTSLSVSVGYTVFATLALFAVSLLAWRWIESPWLGHRPSPG